MQKDKKITLKEKILKEMVSDYHNILDKNFNLAKNLIKVTKNGKIEVIDKESMNASNQILLYLIGSLYAKEAGLSEYGDAGNHELQDELGLPKGTILPALKDLRDNNSYNNLIIKIKEFVEKLDSWYLSLDIDVLDYSYAPGTGYPEKKGMDFENLKKILKNIRTYGNLKRIDLVEVNPNKDVDNKTINYAKEILEIF